MTSVSILDYMIGTCACLIYIILFVIIGCTIWEATTEKDSSGKIPESSRNHMIIIIVVEIVFTIIVTIIITILVMRKLDQAVEEQERRSLQDQNEKQMLMEPEPLEQPAD